MTDTPHQSLDWLSSILDILRVQCPWDRAQTIDSLRYLTIEEVYELSEAILAKDYPEMRKELGDLFMHLLFYSKIAADEQQFTLSEVIDGICRKLISRHPHIPLPDKEGRLQPATVDAKPEWEQVKMKEGRRSVLEGVPATLPPLVKAVRMQEKVAGAGFRWGDAHAAFQKVREEYSELQEVLDQPADAPHRHERAEEEFGDLLLALVCWGNMQGLNADTALSRANAKFQRRYLHVEDSARAQGRQVADLPLADLLALWQEAKSQE